MLKSPALSCAFALLLAGAAWAADPVFPPGSRIGLVPPAGMVPSEGIAGFRDPKTSAGIALVEMPPEAYPSLQAGMADDALRAQGFTLKTRDTVEIGGHKALLISGDQSEGNLTIPKALLLSQEAGMTALVVAQMPPGTPPSDLAKAEEALKTVAIRPPLSLEEQLNALPFKLGDLAGFRPVRFMAGNSLLLTRGPNDGVLAAEQPIMIIAQSVSGNPPADQREAVARQLLAANTFLNDTVLERSQSFRQDGAEWHEIVARAKDSRSGASVVVQQTIRFMPGGYIRMVGIAKADDRDQAMPLFRRIADSVGPK